jgi:hypothetical protein
MTISALPRWTAALLTVLLLAGCNRASSGSAAEPLFLNAASQDRALYVTWSVVPDAHRLTLHWRRAGTPQWQSADAPDRGHYVLQGLDNDTTYELYAERQMAGGERITSAAVAQTPRVRRFDWGPLVYTSQAAAEDYVRKSGIDPGSLHLIGGNGETWSAASPDGAYTTSDQHFVVYLHRHLDDRFTPPLAPHAPAEVRTVLKRALWPTFNPFDHPDRFPMTITPIEPPLVGKVRAFASAESFAIAYHPQLSSRCTRFIPHHPAPGKIAIYLDGHQGGTVRYGAHTVDQLLERGWQVIAMDMPLIGANRSDASPVLRHHDSFLWWQTEDFRPVSLFVQPLKALIDEIYREAGDSNSLAVMLIGKSGGGWTSFMYGALDPRIDYAVSIAGGMPLSLRLRETPMRLGDYEQADPLIYEAVPYEHIMPAAGSRGAFYVYNQHDPCCYRFQPDDPFIRYLHDASRVLSKPIGVYVDTAATHHTFSDTAFAELDRFLATTEARTPGGAAGS